MKMKQNISVETNESLPPVLEKLRRDNQGFNVPAGYFDSLSSRIVDKIKKQENRSFINIIIRFFRKPLVWTPVMATAIVVALLIFVIPTNKTSPVPVTDEWTELNMAYDASYAAEAILAESINIDKEIETRDINYTETSSPAGQYEPTDAEITEYLKNHDVETDILNEY